MSLSDNILIHREIEPFEVHAPYSFEFNNSMEREAYNAATTNDIGKIALQLDNMSIWMLTSTRPIWKRVILEGDPTTPNGVAGGDLEGTYPYPSVIADSHLHTPGVSIPQYPTTLPPSGPAGGDLTGMYPSPQLGLSGVVAGTYQNPTIRVDAKGRLIEAQSNPLPSLSAMNRGIALPLYIDKSNNRLNFRTLGARPGSGLLVSQATEELWIDSPGLAKLTGATFTGDVKAPRIESDGNLVGKTIYSKLHNAGLGTTWQPEVRNGNVQIRELTGDIILLPLLGGEPGTKLTLFLKQPSGSRPALITFDDRYKFPHGMNKLLTPQPQAMDMLEITILSTAFYACILHRNIE